MGANRLRTFLLIVSTSLLLAGCDGLTQPDLDEPAPSPAESKARFLERLDEATSPAPAQSGLLTNTVRLIVGFRDAGVQSDGVATRYRVYSRFEYRSVFPGMAVEVPSSQLDEVLAAMQADPEIAWVEPDLRIGLVDELVGTVVGALDLTTDLAGGLLGGLLGGSTQRTSWAIPAIGADRSWTRSGDGRGSVDVDLYVIDTGVEHQDVRTVECLRFHDEFAGSCGELLGLDLEMNEHGTAVAGVAAAMDDRDDLVGVAPGARVHALQVMGDVGGANLSSIIAALELVTARKQADPARPVVVNLSLGTVTGTTDYNALDRAVQAAIDAGVVCVVAAGNAAIDASGVSPAHVPDAITVAAHDADGAFAGFSNYGSFIDLLAPGVDVESLGSGGMTRRTTGTSIAAPHVAGAAALLLSRYPSLSPQRVRDLLVQRGRSAHGTPDGTTDVRLYIGG